MENISKIHSSVNSKDFSELFFGRIIEKFYTKTKCLTKHELTKNFPKIQWNLVNRYNIFALNLKMRNKLQSLSLWISRLHIKHHLIWDESHFHIFITNSEICLSTARSETTDKSIIFSCFPLYIEFWLNFRLSGILHKTQVLRDSKSMVLEIQMRNW